MTSFTSIRFFSPAAFLIAFIGFFLTFTDINCNGQKLDSVTGFEFVKGYNSELEETGNETGSVEKYSPNIPLSVAFLIALLGFAFYFVRKLRTNYSLMGILASVAFICMIAFMVDLNQKISSIDPDTNLEMEAYVDLEAEMKFGYWLVTLSFLCCAAWNFMKRRELTPKTPLVETQIEEIPPADI